MAQVRGVDGGGSSFDSEFGRVPSVVWEQVRHGRVGWFLAGQGFRRFEGGDGGRGKPEMDGQTGRQTLKQLLALDPSGPAACGETLQRPTRDPAPPKFNN